MRSSASAFAIAVFAVVLAAAVSVGACGRGEPRAGSTGVRPLGTADPTGTGSGTGSTGTVDSTVAVGSSDQARDDSPRADTAPVDETASEVGQPDARRRIDALLDRFDVAITELYRQPLAVGDDSHPVSRQWLDVVIPGSQLDRQVRGRVLAAGTVDRMRVEPPQRGTTSFVNTASEVSEAADGSVTWTNCGFSPGVGVDIADGQVLDDSRAVTRGRGRAVPQPDGTLAVAELWDDSTEVLPAGAENPCEVA